MEGLRKIKMGQCCAEEWLILVCLFSDNDMAYFRGTLKEEGKKRWEEEKGGYELFREVLEAERT